MQECTPPTDVIQAQNPAPGSIEAQDVVGIPLVHSLYLHVPFCFHKCHYCDFYSLVEPKGKPDRQAQFTQALIAELKYLASQHTLNPATLFVGGGTPTLLRADLWAELLDVMHSLGVLNHVTEFTVEANPETVTPELMQVLVQGGVNRVSLGAQSFNVEQLKTLERWHDPDTVPKAVNMVRDAGITNFNLDLIFAIPKQTLEQLDEDLDAVLALNPTHLSCYSLIFEPNTPLTQKMKMGRISPVGEDLEKQMYAHIINRLDHEGFEHYEVSNWARRGSGSSDQGSEIEERVSGIEIRDSGTPKDRESETTHNIRSAEGASALVYSPPDPRHPIPDTRSHRCQHNLAYWTNQNWLGLGPSAASHLAGRRWKNLPHLAKYIQGCPTPPTTDHEHLPHRQHIGEQIMLGLRLREGLTHTWIKQHIPIDDARHQTINELIDINMLEHTPTHLRLTQQGLFLADAVIAKLL